MNFVEHLLRPSALLDLVNIMQVGLDLRNATGPQNLPHEIADVHRNVREAIRSAFRRDEQGIISNV